MSHLLRKTLACSTPIERLLALPLFYLHTNRNVNEIFNILSSCRVTFSPLARWCRKFVVFDCQQTWNYHTQGMLSSVQANDNHDAALTVTMMMLTGLMSFFCFPNSATHPSVVSSPYHVAPLKAC